MFMWLRFDFDFTISDLPQTNKVSDNFLQADELFVYLSSGIAFVQYSLLGEVFRFYHLLSY